MITPIRPSELSALEVRRALQGISDAVIQTQSYPWVKQNIPENKTLTIPNGFGLVVIGPFTIDGSLVVDGALATI